MFRLPSINTEAVGSKQYWEGFRYLRLCESRYNPYSGGWGLGIGCWGFGPRSGPAIVEKALICSNIRRLRTLAGGGQRTEQRRTLAWFYVCQS